MSGDPMDRDAYFGRPHSLIVVRQGAGASDLFLAIDADGQITGFCGHVDLGTGIRTSLAQIIAEELDVALSSITMVLGHTAATPDQGATIASETIQVSAIPLRQAAAGARIYLLGRAAQLLGSDPADLVVEDGVIRIAARRSEDDNRRITYGELIRGNSIELPLDPTVSVKPVASYRIVGHSAPRVDLPAKANGSWVFVHDVRVPGMLHGRVIRPPYAGFDSGPHVGTSLLGVDEASVVHIPGLVAVVAIGDFVGVVAEREEQAIRAARELKVYWKPTPLPPDLNDPRTALRDNPSTPRVLLDQGSVDQVLAGSDDPMARSYFWPYQMHGSIGPSCSVADYHANGVAIWSGTQNPYPLRADIACLLDLAEEQVTIHRAEAAGCYGRNCADDVGADAALLSRAVGRPVRVQLTREQEHAWEPKGAAQIMDVRGGLDGSGEPAAYDFSTRYPSNGAPTLALLLTAKIPPTPAVFEMGDRTAIPPYSYPHMRITVHDMPPIARASWLRGVSAMPNSFAHESYIDELAVAARVDPVEYRLRYLKDPRAIELVRAVAERAAWVPHTGPGSHGGEGDLLYGRGFGYAVYVHGKFPGTAAAYAAWVADVAVNRKTGEIAITKIVVGQDSGLMINPDGVRHQIHGNVIQSASRALKEQVSFDAESVSSREWGSYPIITFPEVPDIDVLLIPRPDEPPLGVGESASVPSAAAICNAVFDATGIRFRDLPLTPERVREALAEAEASALPAPTPISKHRGRLWAAMLTAAATIAGIGTLALPWRTALPTIERPAIDVYARATIEQGRLVAAAGACDVCHVGNDGTALAGGRAFETQFGKIVASNISPDPVHGIGSWSYPAFERAMRQGVSRDGHYLYPVHPYTSFTKANEADLQALYAFLMATSPAARPVPASMLKFPFGLRPLMSVWNTLFLRPDTFTEDPAQTPAWNRGAYLVQSLGHCGACHTERNILGAERGGSAVLAGAMVDGWHAPSLTATSTAPIGWSEQALFDYMRTGFSAEHGSAAGPMAQVIDSLAPLPDSDIRAIATYLATGSPESAAEQKSRALAQSEAAASDAAMLDGSGARIFAGACASCHEGSDLPSLALNSNLHGPRPDNVIHAIVNGVDLSAQHALKGVAPDSVMTMPKFGDSLDADQIASLTRYLRARFAPGKSGWDDLTSTAERIRTNVMPVR